MEIKKLDDIDEIEKVVQKAMVCQIGLADGDQPYVVPVCFGYEKGKLYFHSGLKGRKIDTIKIPKPPKKITKPYEKEKRGYLKNLYVQEAVEEKKKRGLTIMEEAERDGITEYQVKKRRAKKKIASLRESNTNT